MSFNFTNNLIRAFASSVASISAALGAIRAVPSGRSGVRSTLVLLQTTGKKNRRPRPWRQGSARRARPSAPQHRKPNPPHCARTKKPIAGKPGTGAQLVSFNFLNNPIWGYPSTAASPAVVKWSGAITALTPNEAQSTPHLLRHEQIFRNGEKGVLVEPSSISARHRQLRAVLCGGRAAPMEAEASPYAEH
jgi:hypothetical protein